MMLQSGNWGAQSLIAAFGRFVHDGERTATYERNSDNGGYYRSFHCNLPTVRSFLLWARANKRREISYAGGRVLV